MCCDTVTYHPRDVGGMGLDVVHIIYRDSCEGFHRRPADFPQRHGERHHPPYAFLHLHPLQSCKARKGGESETSGSGLFSFTFRFNKTLVLFNKSLLLFSYPRHFPPAPERRSETGLKQQGRRWKTPGIAHLAYTGPTTRGNTERKASTTRISHDTILVEFSRFLNQEDCFSSSTRATMLLVLLTGTVKPPFFYSILLDMK